MRCINKNIRLYLDRNKAVSTVYGLINTTHSDKT